MAAQRNSFRETPLPEYQENKKPKYLGPAPYLPKTAWVPGWPGYRHRPGRSGYDPLENDFEAAHMQGVLLRLVLKRRIRTRNPVYLALMTIFGMVACLPGLLAVALIISGWPYVGGGLIALMFYSPSIVVGVAVLANVYLSFIGDAVGDKDDRMII
jgi:hypothetical protein